MPDDDLTSEYEMSDEDALGLLTGSADPKPEPEPVPEPVPAGNGPEVPSWLSEIPENERVGVAERFLETLTPEQRTQLPTLVNLVNTAYETAAQNTQQQFIEEANDQSREQMRATEASQLYDDIMQGSVPSDVLESRLETYGEVAADTRQAEINDDIQEAIWAGARTLGLQQIPAEVVNRAAQADSWGDALATYSDYFIREAYRRGGEDSQGKSEKTQQTDMVAERARIKAEVLAELQTEGRLKSSSPPSLGESSGSGGGSFFYDDNASEDDLLNAAQMNIAQMKAAGGRR